ncbi:DUF6356 family protein [Sphingomonas sp.]|uniref:DUF6356 family protein n=1 Tax=Sphingomonas sp. TaxID=28214 RepID=UPI003B3B49A2
MFRRLFLDHPASVDESYGQHFRVAAGFGVTMIIGGLAALVHALVPALCKTTGSRAVRRLHERLTGDPQRDGRRPDFEI